MSELYPSSSLSSPAVLLPPTLLTVAPFLGFSSISVSTMSWLANHHSKSAASTRGKKTLD